MIHERTIVKLYLPILAEQYLVNMIGLAGTVLVAHAGEDAISAVSLVNSVYTVILFAFNAVVSGAATVLSQFMGAKEYKKAAETSGQLLVISVGSSLVLSLILFIFARQLLCFLFGGIEQKVMDGAYTYMIASALSIPFLIFYTTLASYFRALGNSRTPMVVSIITNIINICVCIIAIYFMNLGVTGIAIAMLLARIIGAAVMLVLLFKPGYFIPMPCFFPVKWQNIRSALGLGLPMGLDSLMFNGGKLLVQMFLSNMGTIIIAANSIAVSISLLIEIPGNAMLLMTITLIGHAIGEGDEEKAKRLMIGTTGANSVLQLFLCVLMWIFASPAVALYSDLDEVKELAVKLIRLVILFMPVFWSTSFVLPYGLRSTGDVWYTASVSVVSMWIFRVTLAWILGIYCNMGVTGIWIAMIVDWIFRSVAYVHRLVSDKWKSRGVLPDGLKTSQANLQD